jgi:ribosomal protein L37AE/L43A
MPFAFARREAERRRVRARLPVAAGCAGAALAAVAAAGLPFGPEAVPVQVQWTLWGVVAACLGVAAWGMARLRRARRPPAMRQAVDRCPACGRVHTERIPQNVCRIAWRCDGCGALVPAEPEGEAGRRAERRAL